MKNLEEIILLIYVLLSIGGHIGMLVWARIKHPNGWGLVWIIGSLLVPFLVLTADYVVGEVFAFLFSSSDQTSNDYALIGLMFYLPGVGIYMLTSGLMGWVGVVVSKRLLAPRV